MELFQTVTNLSNVKTETWASSAQTCDTLQWGKYYKSVGNLK
jgi:hypothetical protein